MKNVSRALVFTQTNDYGMNVNMHTQTQNELSLKQQKSSQLRGNAAINNANAWQKPGQLDLSPLTSVFSSITKSQRNTQGYIIGDNCYSPNTMKNETSSARQVDRGDRGLHPVNRTAPFAKRLISTSNHKTAADARGASDSVNARNALHGRAL